ncbi:MAG: biotin--[acetyl-CoA-carboxylase] ligase [Flavobacteriales bacterium]|nr:biotin--[acetyl-CoA-carboxylase] ligase [Flavobacteriales bacterium]
MLQFGHSCIHLTSVDSSNNYVADHPDLPSLADGTAIMAYEQTAGKGQIGRSWSMVPGKDIAVSYLVRPRIQTESAYMLNKTIALAVRDLIQELSTEMVHIKWPNDIFVRGKKVAGILIEPAWQGRLCKHVIIGIGINVNSDRTNEDYGAISLKEALGKELDIGTLFDKLSGLLSRYYDSFCSSNLNELDRAYHNALLGRDKLVSCRTKDTIHSSILLKGVDESGRLLLEDDEGVKTFSHGSVEVDYSGIIS